MFLVVAVVIVFGITALTGKAAKSVRISSVFDACDPNILPLAVALENGYFTKENINVSMNPLKGSADILDTNVLVMGRGIFYPLQEKYPGTFKVFNFNLQDESKWNDAVLVNKESEISSVSQLKGKVIGRIEQPVLSELPDSQPAGLMAMLEQNGLNPAEFSTRRASLEDLENNVVDALYIREPLMALALHSGKQKILVEGPIFARYVFSPWPMSVSAISSTFMKQKPETAKQIVRIWDKAIDFIRENPIEADKIQQECMKKNYGQDGVQVRQLNHWKSNETDKNLVQNQLKWYHSIGVTAKELNVNDLLY